MRLKKMGYLCCCVFITTACIKQIPPPIQRSSPRLVVEGMITNDTTPYFVSLSYSGQFTNAFLSVDSSRILISDAEVIIRDDTGDSSMLQLVSPGLYRSSPGLFLGTIGRSYILEIHLSDGKVYVSHPESIRPVPPIDSLSVVYEGSLNVEVSPTRMIIATNTSDPAQQKNFYRWTASGYAPRKSWGTPCSPFDPPCLNPYMCNCNALCEQLTVDHGINILSDQLIDGNSFHRTVYYSPVYWFGKHYIEVKQYSLSPEIYGFWKKYQEQTERTGSNLDPLPAPLIGNIHNVSDSNDLALGYFQASAVAKKRLVIFPQMLQQYLLESIAGQYIPEGDCHSVVPNSLPNYEAPDGWVDVEVRVIH